jgi:heavy metal translocating P-type ATPase
VAPTDLSAPERLRGTYALPLAVVGVLAVMVALTLADQQALAERIGLAGLLLCGMPLLYQTLLQGLRGNFATDAVAALSIVTALILRQPIPGLIIVLMQSGGEALERLAQRRASRALRDLEEGAPRVAHRVQENGYVDVAVSTVRVGERILVRPGEVIPLDGIVRSGSSQVDTAAITGEPMPVAANPGTVLYSGCSNLRGPLVLEATAVAAESQYERIVQLVRSAQASKAPLQRLADRYAVWFTPLTIVVAGLAFALSGEADRILAVLVIATPCPLILATPVAIIGGMNSAAKKSVIVRSGAALEQLARIRAVVFDKTGTLTTGRPAAARLVTLDSWTEHLLLPLVGAVELGSGHVLARAVVEYARSRGAVFDLAEQIEETAGRGVAGLTGGRQVLIGSQQFVAGALPSSTDNLPGAGLSTLRSYIVVDARLAGYIEFEDQLRADLAQLMSMLRKAGMKRLVILSGDDRDTVQSVAAQLDIDEAHADLKPGEKLDHIRRIKEQFGPTLMIGDGTNDAPALAAADVGLAVAARGGGIAAETADVILLGDNLLRVADALALSRRTLGIARQSIVVGLGLSALGMVAAAFGFIPPLIGALYQEAIDVGVILNAVRAAEPFATRRATELPGLGATPIPSIPITAPSS